MKVPSLPLEQSVEDVRKAAEERRQRELAEAARIRAEAEAARAAERRAREEAAAAERRKIEQLREAERVRLQQVRARACCQEFSLGVNGWSDYVCFSDLLNMAQIVALPLRRAGYCKWPVS